MQKPSREEIRNYMKSQEKSALDLWEQIVRIESPSTDQSQVDYLASHLDTYLSAIGLKTEKIPFEKSGASLVAYTEEGEKEGAIALMGHMDTVHPVGAFGDDTFRLEGDSVYGPGVYDCKGGVAAAIFAIRTLKHFGYQDRQLRLILSGDEEVAHSFSGEAGREVYRKHSAGCIAGFNCESGFLDGSVVTERKGGGIVSIHLKGIPAHAGREPEKGASAVREAARMVVKIEDLSDKDKVLFNCGLIQGGTSANVIPAECHFSVGLRFRSNQDYEWAIATLKKICDTPSDERVTASLQVEALFKAMEKTPRTEELLSKYQSACEQLGYDIPNAVSSGGCSDAAFVTSEGIPVLCGVGVRGEGNHSLKERAIYTSLLEQSEKLVLTILDL